jgi:hypothetical protein
MQPRLMSESHRATMMLMQSTGFTFWQHGNVWLGHLDYYPDYITQGTSFEDLKEHLLDLFKDLLSGAIPGARRHAELEVA